MGKKIKSFLNLTLKSLLEIIYPRSGVCILCGKEEEQELCKQCKSGITPCLTNNLCIGYYKGELKELILRFKYKKDFIAGEILVELVEGKLENVEKDYILTYIPISKDGIKVRGYNQCEYIAKELSFRNGYDILNTLEKIRETKIQKTLNKEERIKNVKECFGILNEIKIRGKNFILIDDVLTTGSTLAEGIRVLKNNGANDVKILTLAKSDI